MAEDTQCPYRLYFGFYKTILGHGVDQSAVEAEINSSDGSTCGGFLGDEKSLSDGLISRLLTESRTKP